MKATRTTWVFQQRAIAFLDILGFKELIREAEQQPATLLSLFGLRTAIDAHVRWDNDRVAGSVPEPVKPRYIFVSDSIILSVPLQHGHFDGLGIVVAKSIQIAHKLLEMGYLLRGGIAVGPVWHDDGNVFGTGYICAVEAEKKSGGPRIMLTEAARQHWQASTLANSPMCRMDGDALIADTLFPEYIIGTEVHGRIEDAFRQYRAWIVRRVNDLPAEGPRKKWEWLARAFDRAIVQHGVGVAPIALK
ncbi:MAG: hypothetical protein HYR63_03075 [Proteobacteria bacterium]|nr:hypothetical protein [Pseudomonadota bacterium]MBI3498444.1 hypothetical protein [Pseudomonadota bacterium]